MAKRIHIGTSGWVYKHWKGRFYPAEVRERDWLAFYAKHFDIVELNNTFYRLPPESAVDAWRDTTPSKFRFAVKGSRFITHMKKLKDPELALERFFQRVDRLERKLGPVLFQLPPHWPPDEARFAAFLEALPPGNRYTFEFRHPGWNNPEIERLLRKHNAAVCIFHLAGFQSPLGHTANFTYIRLHGPGGKYQGSYPDSDLKIWADRLREWDLADAWVFFDNDDSGHAPANAARLRELTGS
jgi:uncharacterized protein YecE (DUF72 family)